MLRQNKSNNNNELIDYSGHFELVGTNVSGDQFNNKNNKITQPCDFGRHFAHAHGGDLGVNVYCYQAES